MLATTLTLTVALAAFVPFSTAGYVLEDDYSVNNFFSMFNFFSVCSSSCAFASFVYTSDAHVSARIVTQPMVMSPTHPNPPPLLPA
jgi:hypothetical protein